VQVCAGLCRFVQVCAGLCRFVQVCATLFKKKCIILLNDSI